MLIKSLLQKISLTSQAQFLIAYSGGLDSHVLLHVMSVIREKNPQLSIRAIHVNHHLSPNADSWAAHCSEVCHHLNVELVTKHLSLQKMSKQSLEALAREARYEVFADVLQHDEVLMTAHHQDDQAETLLLQLFRGSGIKGLASIAEYSEFARGELLRPMLELPRESLLSYAQQHNLVWIEDESNSQLCFDRNYLRQHILPQLQQRWPSLSKNLSRTASHCAEADRLLQDYAKLQLSNICYSDNTLSVSGLLNYSDAQQRNILRHWLAELKFYLPSEKKLIELQKSVLQAAPDAKPFLSWKGVEIRRYRDKLYAMSPCQLKHDDAQTFIWNLTEDLSLPQLTLTTYQLRAMGLNAQGLQTLVVKFRQGGETIKLNGHTRSLKKLMQDWGIPPWQRQQIPLLYNHDQLIAVYGYCIVD